MGTRTKTEKLKSPLPMREGVSASRVWLPKDEVAAWVTLLDFLEERFPFISRAILQDRMTRGDIVDETGKPFRPDAPYQGDAFLFYYREIPDEPVIPFKEEILYKDDNIIVIDKPHFLPVTPGGRFVKETLLTRLKHRYNNEDISPIHRLDRETAGVMLFTCNKEVRGAYQSLFQQREVQKTYHAIASINPDLSFPLTHKSHMCKSSASFFLMQEATDESNSEPNSETEIKIIQQKQSLALYELKPVTGKQHQLRVHMMSLGIPLLNDPFYPELLADKGEDYSTPLQLLAKQITFTDPLTGELSSFESGLGLDF